MASTAPITLSLGERLGLMTMTLKACKLHALVRISRFKSNRFSIHAVRRFGAGRLSRKAAPYLIQGACYIQLHACAFEPGFCQADSVEIFVSPPLVYILTTVRYLNPSTDVAYRDFSQAENVTPLTEVLSDSNKAFWIGSQHPEALIIYLHGSSVSRPIFVNGSPTLQ